MSLMQSREFLLDAFGAANFISERGGVSMKGAKEARASLEQFRDDTWERWVYYRRLLVERSIVQTNDEGM